MTLETSCSISSMSMFAGMAGRSNGPTVISIRSCVESTVTARCGPSAGAMVSGRVKTAACRDAATSNVNNMSRPRFACSYARTSAEQFTIESGLPKVLLHFHLDRGEMGDLDLAERREQPSREVLREHLHRRIGDGEQGAVSSRKDIPRRTRIVHMYGAIALDDADFRIIERQQHLMIDLITELLHHLLDG